jgi:hypothetical protein
MAIGVFNPAVPESAKDILLGEGIVYKNYGESGEAIIGATRSGSKLEIDRSIKEIKFDGAYGPVKGMRRYERFVAKLIINFLKLTYTNLAYGLPITVSDGSDKDGTYKKISFDLEIAAADVLTNVAFLGYKENGDYCIIIIENALNIDKLSLDFKEKDEVTSEMSYTGFYTYAAPTTPPLQIWEEV